MSLAKILFLWLKGYWILGEQGPTSAINLKLSSSCEIIIFMPQVIYCFIFAKSTSKIWIKLVLGRTLYSVEFLLHLHRYNSPINIKKWDCHCYIPSLSLGYKNDSRYELWAYL